APSGTYHPALLQVLSTAGAGAVGALWVGGADFRVRAGRVNTGTGEGVGRGLAATIFWRTGDRLDPLAMTVGETIGFALVLMAVADRVEIVGVVTAAVDLAELTGDITVRGCGRLKKTLAPLD
ncbi:MAG: hypothetical protein ACYDB0_13210, partial [Acidithiobacillus sp.]